MSSVSKYRQIYIAGIGGSGLSSLAYLCLQAGIQVLGSDTSNNPDIQDLISLGAEIDLTQDGEFLSQHLEGVDYIVYTPALGEGSRELEVIKNSGKPYSTQNKFVQELARDLNLQIIGIAGTHGKTTTSAMLSWVFHSLDIPVAHLIGSKTAWGVGGQYQAGSEFLIVEADEYAYKFLDLEPDFSIITNIEMDHKDVFKTEKNYFQTFLDYLKRNQEAVVFWQKDYFELEKQTASDFEQDLTRLKPDLQILTISQAQAIEFKANNLVKIIGKYNYLNACQVSVLAQIIFDYKSFSQIKFESEYLGLLETFPGTRRRQERLAERVYTDYAHLPAEIAATIDYFSDLIEVSNRSKTPARKSKPV